MGAGEVPSVGEALPTDAWGILRNEPSARLIDVRTEAEWTFVGLPDLSELGQTLICVEWVGFPGMSKNPGFVDAVLEQTGPDPAGPLLFICRSGARSLDAARAVAARLRSLGSSAQCVNVAEGFEGDRDPNGHRSSLNGWKLRGLAWRQS